MDRLPCYDQGGECPLANLVDLLKDRLDELTMISPEDPLYPTPGSPGWVIQQLSTP